MKKNSVKLHHIGLASMLAICSHAQASELVYQPINPSFGGNPLNGSFLLSKANSQNTHKAPVDPKTYAERLQESLERAYISKIVREITNLAFGEQDYDENGDPIDSIFNDGATFISGDFEVELITSNPDSLTVQIVNAESGEVTIIEIPRFG